MNRFSHFVLFVFAAFFMGACWNDGATPWYPWLQPPSGWEGDTAEPSIVVDTGEEDDGGATFHNPGGGPCPPEMTSIEGGVFVLGEADEEAIENNRLRTTIRDAEYTLPSYCVGTYMFPGGEGDPWPADALYVEQAEALVAALVPTGRRLCTMGELVLAAAGPDNWRFPYDPEEWQEGFCEFDDQNPNPNELGAWESCISPLGVRDFMVRSSWGIIDATTAQALLPYVGQDLTGQPGVYGGTSRDNTFYAPNNFGIHTHAPDPEASYWDDSLRLCMDPQEELDPKQEEAWRQFHDTFLAKGGSYEALLGVGHN